MNKLIVALLVAVFCLSGCVTQPGSTPTLPADVLRSPQVVAMESSLQFGTYLVVKKNPDLRPVLTSVAEILAGAAKTGQVSPLELSKAIDGLLVGQSDDVKVGVGIALNSVLTIYGGVVAENTLSDPQLRAIVGALSESLLAGLQPGSTSLALPVK